MNLLIEPSQTEAKGTCILFVAFQFYILRQDVKLKGYKKNTCTFLPSCPAFLNKVYVVFSNLFQLLTGVVLLMKRQFLFINSYFKHEVAISFTVHYYC